MSGCNAAATSVAAAVVVVVLAPMLAIPSLAKLAMVNRQCCRRLCRRLEFASEEACRVSRVGTGHGGTLSPAWDMGDTRSSLAAAQAASALSLPFPLSLPLSLSLSVCRPTCWSCEQQQGHNLSNQREPATGGQ